MSGQEKIYAPILPINVAQSREGDLRLGTADASSTLHILDLFGPANVSGQLTISDSLNVLSALTVDTNSLLVDTLNDSVGVAATPTSTKLTIQGGTLDGLKATSTGGRALSVIVGNFTQAITGMTSAAGKAGVFGQRATSTGYGVFGESENPDRSHVALTGVKGEVVAGALGGTKRGVVGSSSGSGASGVLGEATFGPFGTSTFGDGGGVFGRAAGSGVYGTISSGSSAASTYSIYAASPTTGTRGTRQYSLYVGSPTFGAGVTEAYAGYFDGTVRVAREVSARRFLPTELQPSFLPFTSGQSLVVDSSLPASAIEGLAFDGTSMWVGYRNDGTIRKVRASDGLKVGEIATTAKPVSLAFDGTSVWVLSSDAGTNKLYRINVASYTVTEFSLPAGTPTDLVVGSQGQGGSMYLWVSYSAGALYKIRPEDGSIAQTDSLVSGATALIFDGTNIWVANGTANSVTRCLATALCSGGNRLDVSLAPETNAVDIVSDGSYVWVANKGTGTVTKIRTSDGRVVGNYGTGAGAVSDRKPVALAQDGTFLWVANLNVATASVSKLRLADGSLVAEYPLASWTDAGAMLFDGTSVWVGVEAAAAPTLIRRYAGTGYGQEQILGSVTVVQGYAPAAQTGNLNISGTAIMSTLNVGTDLSAPANVWGGSDVTKPVAPGSSVNCDSGEFLKGIQTTDGTLTAIICRKL